MLKNFFFKNTIKLICVVFVFLIVLFCIFKYYNSRESFSELNVCLNYYGQPRKLDITKNTYDNYIKLNENDPLNVKYHILYTTWKSENVGEFKTLFPESYVEQIDEPNMENYEHIIKNYKMDSTNILNSNKSVENYIKGLFVKQKSFDTIERFEKEKNSKFDFIITMRTDVYLDKHLPDFYETIMSSLDNNVYVAKEPKFTIYNNPSLPDVISIADKESTKRIVGQLDILPNCVVNDSDFFHPETSFYNALKYSNLNIIELDFKAFPQPLETLK